MDQLKTFISYSANDKVMAGQFKDRLETLYGFDVFVAHDDNIPSLEWDPEIVSHIKRSDIVLLLVSKYSKNSIFVNQEIGVALCEKKRLFPIKLDETNPFGFIAKIQGFPLVPDYNLLVNINCIKLFAILTSIRSEFNILGEYAIYSACYALTKSKNFIDSNFIIKSLTEAHRRRRFSQEHLKLLENACKTNFEVYGGAFEYPSLKLLLEKVYHISGLY